MELRYSKSIANALKDVAQFYAQFSSVVAVVLSGSYVSGSPDLHSDLDIYVYSEAPIPLDARRDFLQARASRLELDVNFWENTDEWEDRKAAMRIDLMFRSPLWIESQLDDIVFRHIASIGYSTCLWHNVLEGAVIYEREGWYTNLQSRYQVAYPTKLRDNIIAKNHPLLRSSMSSFLGQMVKAHRRHDMVSVHHRCSALLASYFDILFAINQVPHPGEKHLMRHAGLLRHKPRHQDRLVTNLLRAQADTDTVLSHCAFELLDALDELMNSLGLAVQKT